MSSLLEGGLGLFLGVAPQEFCNHLICKGAPHSGHHGAYAT